jgi:hypothetical protein
MELDGELALLRPGDTAWAATVDGDFVAVHLATGESHLVFEAVTWWDLWPAYELSAVSVRVPEQPAIPQP